MNIFFRTIVLEVRSTNKLKPFTVFSEIFIYRIYFRSIFDSFWPSASMVRFLMVLVISEFRQADTQIKGQGDKSTTSANHKFKVTQAASFTTCKNRKYIPTATRMGW